MTAYWMQLRRVRIATAIFFLATLLFTGIRLFARAPAAPEPPPIQGVWDARLQTDAQEGPIDIRLLTEEEAAEYQRQLAWAEQTRLQVEAMHAHQRAVFTWIGVFSVTAVCFVLAALVQSQAKKSRKEMEKSRL